jgi:lysozyme
MNGVDLIKKWEGCKLKAYLCPAGVPTIGYGHTKGVKMGDVITEDVANSYLLDDIIEAHKGIDRVVKVSLTDNQLGALTSFVFNLGIGNLTSSTLLKLINQGKYLEASAQFLRWDKANGTTLIGLTNRRAEEMKLFNS